MVTHTKYILQECTHVFFIRVLLTYNSAFAVRRTKAPRNKDYSKNEKERTLKYTL